MIVLTRLDGARCAINDEQIERIDETPTTLVRLLNGNSYPVQESLDDVIDRIAAFRARAHAHLTLGGRVPVVPTRRAVDVLTAIEGP
jgi:flagellar protein FlbD